MFQLQEFNPILVPDEWCCTSRVIIGLGVPLTPVMYLTSNCSNCGILFKKECLGHLKAHLFGHWRMYQWWKEGYDFASSCNYMYTYLYFLFYDQCSNFHSILLVATFWILTFQWQCVVPPPLRRDFPKTLFPLEISINLHTPP